MAKYFSLSPSTFADDFKAALEAYYGDGVTIESASGNTITFQCPAVCDKVLKIETKSAGFNAYIGNSVENMTLFSFSYEGAATSYNLILADAFILIDSISTRVERNSALIAKLTNGRFMVSGGVVSNGSEYQRRDNKCCFTDTMVFRPIRMVAPYSDGFKSNGKLCLLPSFVADDQEVELNADGAFASIPGLWLAPTIGTPVVGGNYYLSQSGLYGLASEGCYCYSQKYVELETEV